MMMMISHQRSAVPARRSRRLMSSSAVPLLFALVVLHCSVSASALNQDGILLLNFKYTVMQDPQNAMANWNYDDVTPCSWSGVTCASFPDSSSSSSNQQQQQQQPQQQDTSRVISLILPSSNILGPISPDLGLLDHLQHLDLSSNSLNGTLPDQLFNASNLQVLSLSNNKISGSIPDQVAGLRSLETLNLSDNALTGLIPTGLSHLPNLTVLGLANNFLAGQLESGYDAAQRIDLSSNSINGTLPSNGVGGDALRYLNLSANRITGGIPAGFASGVPSNAKLDLSFNNLTGPIPEALAESLSTEGVAGNPGLCGKPLKNLCAIPSSLSQPSAEPAGTSPPAFAVMPKVPRDENSNISVAHGGAGSKSQQGSQDGGSSSGLKPMAIAGIIVGDLAGIALLFAVLSYFYYAKRKKAMMSGQQHQQLQGLKPSGSVNGGGGSSLKQQHQWSSPMVTTEKKTLGALTLCMGKKKRGNGEDDSDETSESTGSDSDAELGGGGKRNRYPAGSKTPETAEQQVQKKPGVLVNVDGETELELDTLLKASAYILGATGSSIVYKAVLADGTAYAVRRIGEGGSSDKLKEFEGQVKAIAKLRHPNIVRVRGFYWGSDEKLLICDFVPNGSLANISYKKPGSSPFQMRWEARLRIARGVARGLAYLHDKKAVHGNLKPSNILLGPDMEPRIGDFGLDRLTGTNLGDSSNKPGASFRHFGSKRSTLSQNSLQDNPSPSAGASPYGGSSSSHYHAPECFKNIKPSPKWDVFSFGVLLLELLTGRVFSEPDLLEWGAGFAAEDRARAVRMADVAIRGEVEGMEDGLLSCFRLAFGCANVSPQRRPSMKEAVQVLEKMPPFCSAASLP